MWSQISEDPSFLMLVLRACFLPFATCKLEKCRIQESMTQECHFRLLSFSALLPRVLSTRHPDLGFILENKNLPGINKAREKTGGQPEVYGREVSPWSFPVPSPILHGACVGAHSSVSS